MWPVADLGGAVWGNLPPNVCGAPLKQRASDINAPLFWCLNEVETVIWTNNALHFVELQDLRAGLWPSFLSIGINNAILS